MLASLDTKHANRRSRSDPDRGPGEKAQVQTKHAPGTGTPAANPLWAGLTLGSLAGDGVVYRSVVSGQSAPGEGGEGEKGGLPNGEPPPRVRGVVIPSPETCPPPPDIDCDPATTSPAGVTNTLIFPVNSATLSAIQLAEIDTAAASILAMGGSTARVDGYASAEGACGHNWDLSCRRAKAVAAELNAPSDGTPGVSVPERVAHGESDEAGRPLAPNRKATISVPPPPPPPLPVPAPAPPVCPLPVLIGSGRGCGGGSDFTHHDFPSISIASELALAAWATAFHSVPHRALVSDVACEIEMDGVLVGLGGFAGHAAFSRFAAGSGGTETHGSGSTLGAMALTSGSFLATVATVKTDVEAALAAQASSGVLDPCALSVTVPETHFGFSDGAALKAVIGGTQGEQLFVTSFAGNAATRSYTMDLQFLICDDFGVDEADLYGPGLFPFWVLQHERSASAYAPFVNELDLTVTVSGTF